jgi:hypothetical protein
MRAGSAIKPSAATAAPIARAAAREGGPSLIDRVREVLAICSRACAAAHFYEEHKPMSDAALAEKGLARADLPRAAFDKLTEADVSSPS